MTQNREWEPSRRARRRALQALYQWQLTDQGVHDITTQFFQEQDFSKVDEDLFKRLLAGVVAHDEELREALKVVLDRPMKDVDVMERIILLMGAWQLKYCPELPWQVVVSESVDLANRFGSAQSHAYVNAVLDRAAHAWGTTSKDLPGSAI